MVVIDMKMPRHCGECLLMHTEIAKGPVCAFTHPPIYLAVSPEERSIFCPLETIEHYKKNRKKRMKLLKEMGLYDFLKKEGTI